MASHRLGAIVTSLWPEEYDADPRDALRQGRARMPRTTSHQRKLIDTFPPPPPPPPQHPTPPHPTPTPQMSHRPFLLLAELTYQCPLHCPYCSNPTTYPTGTELSTSEWQRVLQEAAKMGVLHVGFSGGEPLLRDDLPELIRTARAAGLYTNLITSGVGLNQKRAAELRAAGLDSAQLSFQSDEPTQADAIAGARVHRQKLDVAKIITRRPASPLQPEHCPAPREHRATARHHCAG